MNLKLLLNNSKYINNYDDICSICRDATKNNLCRQLSCNHIFHCECIDTWLSESNSCPYCRQIIQENNPPILDEKYGYFNNINNIFFNIIKFGSIILLIEQNRNLRFFIGGLFIGGVGGAFFGIGTTFFLFTHIRSMS